MMSSGRLCGPLSLLFVLFLHLSNASATLSALSACRAISNAVPGRVAWPLSFQYHSEIRSYWSSALHEVKPACVVRPRSVDEVSAAIKVLNKYPDVVFAAKSGGHDPNPGHATAHNGVLITMKDISGTTYDQAKKLAYVKPGGEWNDVISTLQPYNVTVVGGRLGRLPFSQFILRLGAKACRHCRYWRISDSRGDLILELSIWTGRRREYTFRSGNTWANCGPSQSLNGRRCCQTVQSPTSRPKSAQIWPWPCVVVAASSVSQIQTPPCS